MTSLLVPACPATLARLTMWPHCWSNISGRKACDEIWDQELLFGGIFMFKTAPWSSKSEPARWPQKSSQSWFCTESYSLKISLKRDLASGVSSSAVPDTIPALFTRILTVPTWKYWEVPLRCTPPSVVISPLLGKLLLVFFIVPQISNKKSKFSWKFPKPQRGCYRDQRGRQPVPSELQNVQYFPETFQNSPDRVLY